MVYQKRFFKILKTRSYFLLKRKKLFCYINNQIKLLWSYNRKKVVLPKPNSLMIEVTNKCQLKCIICGRASSYGNELNKGDISFTYAKKIIDETYLYLDRICLTGLGEPLLYPELKKLITYIRNKHKGISIFISTNAQHPKISEIISSIANKIDTLQISIDGCGSTYEEIRCKSNYSKFIMNLEKISEIVVGKRVSVKFNMVVFRKNYQQMIDVIKLAKRLKFQEIYFNTINLVSTDWNISEYDIFQSDTFYKKLKEASLYAKKQNIYISFPIYGKKSPDRCPFIWNNFYITWDGYLVPCCAKPFPKLKNFGNVFKNDLMSCINSKEFIDFRQDFINNIQPEFCEKCHFFM